MTVPPSRGKTIYPHVFSVAVDDETDAAVRAYAERSGVKLATALRELIEYGLESCDDDADG